MEFIDFLIEDLSSALYHRPPLSNSICSVDTTVCTALHEALSPRLMDYVVDAEIKSVDCSVTQ